MGLEVVQIINKPVSSNCFLIFDPLLNNKCLVIDPGSEFEEELVHELIIRELHPEYVLLTHEHFDHIWSVNSLIDRYQVKVICSRACSNAIQDPKRNHSLFYNQKAFKLRAADICLEDIAFRWQWNGWNMSFFIAEGHTNAGMCFVIDKFLFTGDTLLKDLRTVTKLFCGSKEKLYITIDKIKELQGRGYLVLPGQGDIFELDKYDLNRAF